MDHVRLAAPPPFDPARLAQALNGRYTLAGQLGHGGMGYVFLARDERLDRPVAIKFLAPARAADPLARERFLREARTAARLSHPNIVPIFAVEQADELVYFVMAYVEGETLAERVRLRGPLPPFEAARVLRDVGWALGYAHAQGVVHRDVKPDNILLETATGRAIVTDFGIARRDGTTGTTGPNQVIGTAEFLSPEQVAGSPADARSDIYALGIVGFHALTGLLPFTAADPATLLAQHLTRPAPPVATFAPGVPRRLAAAVDRCLAKDPAARLPTGGAFVQELVQVLEERSAPPVALRAFLTESRDLSGPALGYWTILGAGVAPLTLLALLAGVSTGLAAGIVALAGAAFAAPIVVMRARVRRLLAAGLDREDLVEALEAEWACRREEAAFTYGPGASRIERAATALAYAGLGMAAGVVAAGLAWPAAFGGAGVAELALGGAVAAVVGALVARARTEQRTDPKIGRRIRFWRGPLGRWLFRLARSRRGADLAAPASVVLSAPLSESPPGL